MVLFFRFLGIYFAAFISINALGFSAQNKVSEVKFTNSFFYKDSRKKQVLGISKIHLTQKINKKRSSEESKSLRKIYQYEKLSTHYLSTALKNCFLYLLMQEEDLMEFLCSLLPGYVKEQNLNRVGDLEVIFKNHPFIKNTNSLTPGVNLPHWNKLNKILYKKILFKSYFFYNKNNEEIVFSNKVLLNNYKDYKTIIGFSNIKRMNNHVLNNSGNLSFRANQV